MTEIYAALITAVVGVITAGGALLVSWLKSKKIKAEVDSIRAAIDDSGGVYWVTCPACGTRVYLKGAEIHVDASGGEEKKA